MLVVSGEGQINKKIPEMFSYQRVGLYPFFPAAIIKIQYAQKKFHNDLWNCVECCIYILKTRNTNCKTGKK